MTRRTRCSRTEIDAIYHFVFSIVSPHVTPDRPPSRPGRRLKTPSGNRPIRSYFSDRNGSRGYVTASPSHGDLLRALNYERRPADLRDLLNETPWPGAQWPTTLLTSFSLSLFFFYIFLLRTLSVGFSVPRDPTLSCWKLRFVQGVYMCTCFVVRRKQDNHIFLVDDPSHRRSKQRQFLRRKHAEICNLFLP